MKLNQTLVSLYGEKTIEFRSYVLEIVSILKKSAMGNHIKFYQPDQMHATLIGLEANEEDGRLLNRNLLEKEGKKEEMRFDRMKEVIDRYFPMKIRFGGFKVDDEEFLSRGKRPWERSFCIDLIRKRIIMMGWPHVDGDFSKRDLMKFREDMRNDCHIRHKYTHDNDFYIVLAELVNDLLIPEDLLTAIEEKARNYLSENPLDIDIDKLLIASYIDPRLILSSTHIHNCWSKNK